MKKSDATGFIEGITQYIQKQGKQSIVPKVTELFDKLSDQSQKETVAHVTTSVQMTTDEQEGIERLLFRLVGHPVTLTVQEDKDLIGGMKISLGDWVVDTSLSGQVDRMAKDMLK